MPISIAVQQDCIKFMRGLADKSVKLAIVDPPYYSGPELRKHYGASKSKTNVARRRYTVTEAWNIPTEEYFHELWRVSENQIIWGVNYFSAHIPGSGRIVWDKCNGSNSFSDCELAYCSLHDSVRIFRYMWNGMMQGKSIYEGHVMQGDKRKNELRIHPTQKPVLLYKWLLQQYAKPGDNILDTHLGSGSSRIAAYDMGFDFCGCEIDGINYLAQQRRFKTHISQQSLFPV